MAPQVVAVDEIGNYEDLKAISQTLLSGSKILATIHGESLDEINKLSFIKELKLTEMFERFVVLHKKGGICAVKAVYGGDGKI
jgi:stage III sporulation protein AA